jgi:hypothetical protein
MTYSYYKSECDEYLCRYLGFGHYEAWTIDGEIHWVHDDRVKTWEDEKKRMHPLPFCVGGYSAEKTGQKKGSFTVTLLRCDVKKYIKPWTGNTVIESLDIVFRRKVQSTHTPRWLKETL